MIPMRDGISLETVLFSRSAMPKALPMLLARTPYGIPKDDRNVRSEWYVALRADGYIFVFQNLRGRFGSEGVFVMERPPREERAPTSVDETTDAYDTIEWLVQHVPHNSGRVGMLGGSYSAWTATMALIEPHPALAVVSEAASPADQFVGDDITTTGPSGSATALPGWSRCRGRTRPSRSIVSTATSGSSRSGRCHTSTSDTFTGARRPGISSSSTPTRMSSGCGAALRHTSGTPACRR
jgi:putative CocE/NonD family hydrolase